jgi:hypothetical protein
MQRAGVKVECCCVPFHISLLLCGVLLALDSRAQRTPHTHTVREMCASVVLIARHISALQEKLTARVLCSRKGQKARRARRQPIASIPLAEDEVIVCLFFG